MAIDIATIQHGSQTDYKKLYYSNPDAALKVPITLQAGYGLLPVGTLLAQNISAAGNRGKFVPYNLTVFDGTEWSPGRAYLVADVTGVTYVYVTMDDSYKFAVGDDLTINDTGNFIANGLVVHNTRWDFNDIYGRIINSFTEKDLINGQPATEELKKQYC